MLGLFQVLGSNTEPVATMLERTTLEMLFSQGYFWYSLKKKKMCLGFSIISHFE